MKQVDISLPAKMQPLFKPYRYKVFYGGRAAAKSHSVAEYLIFRSVTEKLRILCCREFQNSVKESVYRLLVDKIVKMGIEHLFHITETSIKCTKTGSEFLFEGLRHNATKIKSMERIGIAWVEEGQTISKASFELLAPTVLRNDGAEIVITYNPELDDDYVHQHFVINEPPKNSVVVKINWQDNPHITPAFRDEILHARDANYDSYLHIWEGHTRKNLEGAVYAEQLRDMLKQERICRAPYDPSKPVTTSWDLGKRDSTCIVFTQKIGLEHRVIDYYENQGKFLSHYISALNERPYNYLVHNLPHDGDNEQLGGKSIRAQLQENNIKPVKVIPRIAKKIIGIEAVRNLLGQLYIDEKNAGRLLHWLQRYTYDINPRTGLWSLDPKHDEASHANDALQTYALSLRDENKPSIVPFRDQNPANGGIGWMGR